VEPQIKLPWLDWSSRLQVIAQNGLTYARDPFDVDRFTAVREIAAEMIASGAGGEVSVVRELLGKDSGHATPKVDVRGVVFKEHKLLLVRERIACRERGPGGVGGVGIQNALQEAAGRVRPQQASAPAAISFPCVEIVYSLRNRGWRGGDEF
jgi:hypothetical protein